MRTDHEELRQSLTNEKHSEYNQLQVSYAIHMHPITHLKSPDLLDEAKNSLFQITCQILYAALPLILCLQLNIVPSLMNLYLIGNHEGPEIMAAVGLGAVLANIFGFLIIENMSVGFSVLCSYFTDNKQQIGFMYQKTLGLNFFVCIVVTPVLYLSDWFLIPLGFSQSIVENSTNYLWALVPSFYLFSFYETTKSYLHSQGIIYPSLVVSTIGCILHFFIAKLFIVDLQFGVTGAAWAMNISLGINSLILYLYILKEQPTKDSWIQWNICATNNVHKFLWEIITHEIFIYLKSIAFQILSIIACHLSDLNLISAHFAVAYSFYVFYFMITGVSHCVNRTLSVSIQENQIQIGKKKILLALSFVMIVTLILITNLISSQELFFTFFHDDPSTIEAIKDIFSLFLFILFFDSIQIILMGILSTLQIVQTHKISAFCFYIVGLLSAILLSYGFHKELWGIWMGWLLGILAALGLEIRYIRKADWTQLFSNVRDKYKIMQQTIRDSRKEISSLLQNNNN